jgi:hypothetical protein
VVKRPLAVDCSVVKVVIDSERMRSIFDDPATWPAR